MNMNKDKSGTMNHPEEIPRVSQCQTMEFIVPLVHMARHNDAKITIKINGVKYIYDDAGDKLVRNDVFKARRVAAKIEAKKQGLKQ